MNESTWTIDVDTRNFQAEVLLRSREVPVLIDFWAAWCAPCKTLGPILEKLARDAKGRFVLAKVDIDKNPELAEAFRIQSVPTVLLVKDGRPVDGFLGVLPEPDVRAFLEPHLGPPPGDVLERARELAEAGERDEAIELLREHLRKQSEDSPARALLAAQLLAAGRAAEARKVYERLPEDARGSPEAKAVKARLELLESAGSLEDRRREVAANPDDLAARIGLGRALLAAEQHEEGLEAIFEAALRDVEFEGGAPRKALLEAFHALGPTHPLTLEYQQRLSVLLCS